MSLSMIKTIRLSRGGQGCQNILDDKIFLLSSISPNVRMAEWTTYDFTFFSTVFQSYQDDGRMIMKVSVQWDPVYG